MLEVLNGGLHTTVQDMGRRGVMSLGIPPSGAQDGFALRVGNLLVGNPPGGPLVLGNDPGSAGLEITLGRMKLRAERDQLIALTGADLGTTIDAEPAPLWQAIMLKAGQVLACGMAKLGARGYLAVRGGIDVPLYLGSRATHVNGKFGGVEGRILKAGDRFAVGPSPSDFAALVGRRWRADLMPAYTPPWQVRVVPGPEAHLFTEASVERFYATAWKLNPKSDRTGMRLMGPKLEFKPGRPRYLVEDAGTDPSNIVIDPGAPVGTIQVPSGVEPIVLGVDSPTIGGYARIGTVITIDMAHIGQACPMEIVRFVEISYRDSVAALCAHETLITAENIVD